MLAQIDEKSPEQPKKMGRPIGSTKLQPTEETIKQIEGLARIQCTMKEAGAVLGVNEVTFSSFLKAHQKAMEAWENGKDSGRASLRRSQYKMAETNPTMSIWLGKQYLDQTDKLIHGGDEDNPIKHAGKIELVIVDPTKLIEG